MDVKRIVERLLQKELLLYPTDTVWGIGGDATNSQVVSRVYKLKKREDSKALICLVDSLEMLREYVTRIPEKALSYIADERPTTIIYEHSQGLAQNLIADDGSIAIRIPKHEFCLELIKTFGRPIISTSANLSGNTTPINFDAIETKILEGVDYVVPLQMKKILNQSSRILKINDAGMVETIRP
ncbi:L-threonylcarbamoyladenylate synthase [Flavobacteriaceae bacterium]|nr:L-threonylcarbamoyladenylate synthase [Flavobacteriaceae bacterium]